MQEGAKLRPGRLVRYLAVLVLSVLRSIPTPVFPDSKLEGTWGASEAGASDTRPQLVAGSPSNPILPKRRCLGSRTPSLRRRRRGHLISFLQRDASQHWNCWGPSSLPSSLPNAGGCTCPGSYPNCEYEQSRKLPFAGQDVCKCIAQLSIDYGVSSTGNSFWQ